MVAHSASPRVCRTAHMALVANRSVSNHWLVTVMSCRKMCRALSAVLRCVRDVFHSCVRVVARWCLGSLKVNKCEMMGSCVIQNLNTVLRLLLNAFICRNIADAPALYGVLRRA